MKEIILLEKKMVKVNLFGMMAPLLKENSMRIISKVIKKIIIIRIRGL
jgi:hypothetical protein